MAVLADWVAIILRHSNRTSLIYMSFVICACEVSKNVY